MKKRLTQRQAARLLNVAKALREYEHPERFTMKLYLHGDQFSGINSEFGPKMPQATEDWCGTPGCALGTFSSRPDLQRLLVVKRYTRKTDQHEKGQPYMALRDGGAAACFDTYELMEYFGISYDEAQELFNFSGCGNAKTPIEAAKYIERFVDERT